MNYAVVMAGGTGTRFWPVSRLHLPKQLLPFGGETTLLEQTVERVAPLAPAERVLVVTGDAIVEKTAATLPQLPAGNVISEPLRRNTAPCAAVAAKVLMDRDPDAVLVLLPADHVILDAGRFRAILGGAMAVAASEDVLITLGVKPHRPETGYGYIEMGEQIGAQGDCPYHRVAAFHEKPDAKAAEQYLATGRFLWNAGIFVFSARAFLAALAKTLPDLFAAIQPLDGTAPPEQLKRTIDAIYPDIHGVSIDVGVMEKVDNLLVFPADIGWSDVGSWTALRELQPPDAAGNVIQGRFISMDESRGNTVYAHDGVVVAVGVENLIIVHTPDATLVARRDDAQAVKKVFDELERRGWKQYM
jgi:mannose-1-phosphate guanylyltransferase